MCLHLKIIFYLSLLVGVKKRKFAVEVTDEEVSTK